MSKAGKNLIAGGHEATAGAAAEALKAGGNAFDAAVAGVFMAMVAESTLTSAGGGGCLLAKPVNSDPVLFDFFVDMPRGDIPLEKDFFSIDIDFGGAVQEFHIGRASVAVPGTVAGLLRVHERLGSLPLSDLLYPAVEGARSGVLVGPGQAYIIKILEPILTREPGSREIYQKDGRLLGAEDFISMPSFSDFLEELGTKGAKFLYRGEGAAILAEWSRECGGLLTAEDLSEYRVYERSPLKIPFRGYEILLNPPPAQSGWLMEMTLALLALHSEKRSWREDLIRSLDLTNLVRSEIAPEGVIGDVPVPYSKTSEFSELRRQFEAGLKGRPSSWKPDDLGSTTHLSILDSQGNAATVTTTNGEGCGSIPSGLGFMLNNMLGEQDLSPKGFFRFRGGSRLPTMVAPTIVLERGRPVLVTGSSGSNRIRSAVIQLILKHLVLGMSLADATESPRLHVEGTTLSIEPGISETQIRNLSCEFVVEKWKETNLFFGGVNSVTCDSACSDSRRAGCSLVL